MTAHDDRARDEQPNPGCDACRLIGPLLTAPGTSGRSWRCECGKVWAGPGAAPDEQPAPAGDDELREADEVDELEEELQGTSQLLVNMVARAEQAERERDAARAEVERLRARENELTRVRRELTAAVVISQRERDAARAEVEWERADNDRLTDMVATLTGENVRARAEVARLHTWAGLMSLLDEHYPADVMTGESGDPGPRIVALVRAVAELKRRDEAAAAVDQHWDGTVRDTTDDNPLWAALDAMARVRREGER